MGWLDSLIEQSGLFSPPVPPELGRLASMSGVSEIVKSAVKTAYLAGVRDGITASAVLFVVVGFVVFRKRGAASS